MTFRSTATKIAATGLAASVAALAAGAGNASAAESRGIGSASVATTILDAKVGDLLGVTVLKDSSFANTDPKAGPLGAVAKLTSLNLSSTVTALNQTLGDYRVSSPGSPSSTTGSILDLGSRGIPAAVLAGQIEPVTLTALHDPTSATTTSAKIAKLDALGGLLNVGAVTSTDKTGSGTLAAQATRNLSIDAITGLKLGELLKMLGFNLLELPLSTINGLLKTLGLPVGLPANTDLQTYVASLGKALDTLEASTEKTVQPVYDTLVKLPGVATLVPTVESSQEAVVAIVVNTLQGLIDTVVAALENAVLIEVTALSLKADTKATDAVGTSSATASGTLGGIKVGKVTIPGVDVTATADTVNATLGKVEGALNTVLAPLGLSNLVRVRLFDRTTATTAADGYVKAVAQITALSLEVKPPAALSTIIAGVTDDVAPDLLSSGAKALPLPQLAQALGGVSSVLKDGLKVEVGRVTAQALHAVPATATPGTTATAAPTELPRTGGEAAPLALGALTLGGLALATRRLGRRSRPAAQ